MGMFQLHLLVFHFLFFKYTQGLMQEKLQLLKNVHVPEVPRLVMMGN